MGNFLFHMGGGENPEKSGLKVAVGGVKEKDLKKKKSHAFQASSLVVKMGFKKRSAASGGMETQVRTARPLLLAGWAGKEKAFQVYDLRSLGSVSKSRLGACHRAKKAKERKKDKVHLNRGELLVTKERPFCSPPTVKRKKGRGPLRRKGS